MFAAGGNAIDAAIAACLAASVVEPAMSSIFGAGFVVIRRAGGEIDAIDNYIRSPAAAYDSIYRWESVEGGIFQGRRPAERTGSPGSRSPWFSQGLSRFSRSPWQPFVGRDLRARSTIRPRRICNLTLAGGLHRKPSNAAFPIPGLRQGLPETGPAAKAKDATRSNRLREYA